MSENNKGRKQRRGSTSSVSSRKSQGKSSSKKSNESNAGTPSVRKDAIALIVLACAIIVALREWFGLSGLLGDFIHHATAGLVGLLSYIVPLILLLVALSLFRFRLSFANKRVFIALALIIAAVDSLVVHRIINIDGETITTKGDANKSADEPINVSAIKGKVLFWIPFAGNVVGFIKTPLGTICIIAAAIALIEIPRRNEKKKDDRERKKIIEEIERLKQEKQS